MGSQGFIITNHNNHNESAAYVTGAIPMNAVVNGVYLVNLITDVESVSSKTIKF